MVATVLHRARNEAGYLGRAQWVHEHQGADVTHTADPAVALELAAAECWDLVLTDVEMPGMNGLELLDALRRIAPALPVAVLTAHAHLSTAALFSRADEFLTKPVRVDQLLATAAALIYRAPGRQEPATGQ